MALIGFLKDVAGVKRMRFVKPGNNADDYSTPANAVTFDTGAADTMPIFRSGVFPIGGDVSGALIDSWATLGFVPLHAWQAEKDGWYQTFIPSAGTANLDTACTATGLYLTAASLSYPVNLHYIIWRRPL